MSVSKPLVCGSLAHGGWVDVMVTRSKSEKRAPAHASSRTATSGRVMIIEARYYDDIADQLLAGARRELAAAGVGFEVVSVPGALEIPMALALAIKSGRFKSASGQSHYSGVVALGCVIRGETAHFDIVCNNANHWLTEQAVRHAIPLGNAILTVESKDQAQARAASGDNNKGGDAARACLALMALAQGGTVPVHNNRSTP